MDEFVALTAHELTAPLTLIRGYVEMAHQDVQEVLSQNRMLAREVGAEFSAAAEKLERAEQHIGRLTRLVNELLDVSRIHAGHLKLHLDSRDLAEIARTAVEAARLAWPARIITLDVPEDVVFVRVDADRIGQVLTNYATNALKYSAPDRPVAVRLRLEGTEAEVQVRDQGPGLTREQQTHIWDRYGRVQGVAVQDHAHGASGGLGLGLYISRTIVEQHGGRVGVESTPGVGATFLFVLPLA